jgi:hypothetical protein
MQPDPRVSTPDDGFPLMDDADSAAEEATLEGTFDPDVAGTYHSHDAAYDPVEPR